jgi:hypothetical protein
MWSGSTAAHIFTRCKTQLWQQANLRRFPSAAGDSKMDGDYLMIFARYNCCSCYWLLLIDSPNFYCCFWGLGYTTRLTHSQSSSSLARDRHGQSPPLLSGVIHQNGGPIFEFKSTTESFLLYALHSSFSPGTSSSSSFTEYGLRNIMCVAAKERRVTQLIWQHTTLWRYERNPPDSAENLNDYSKMTEFRSQQCLKLEDFCLGSCGESVCLFWWEMNWPLQSIYYVLWAHSGKMSLESRIFLISFGTAAATLG